MNGEENIVRPKTQLSYRKSGNDVFPKTFASHIFINNRVKRPLKGSTVVSVGGIPMGDDLENYETLEDLIYQMFYEQGSGGGSGIFWEQDVTDQLTDKEINF